MAGVHKGLFMGAGAGAAVTLRWPPQAALDGRRHAT
jgi:hypothetical protein